MIDQSNTPRQEYGHGDQPRGEEAVIDLDKIKEAAERVYRELGTGHSEAVYEAALEIELTYLSRDLFARRQVPCPIRYRNMIVGTGFIDLLVGETLIIEVKTISKLSLKEETQVKKYLESSNEYQRGLLINFGPSLEMWEVVRSIKPTNKYMCINGLNCQQDCCKEKGSL